MSTAIAVPAVSAAAVKDGVSVRIENAPCDAVNVARNSSASEARTLASTQRFSPSRTCGSQDAELKELRVQLSAYERSFKARHARAPSGSDLNDEMRSMYRRYRELKSRNREVLGEKQESEANAPSKTESVKASDPPSRAEMRAPSAHTQTERAQRQPSKKVARSCTCNTLKQQISEASVTHSLSGRACASKVPAPAAAAPSGVCSTMFESSAAPGINAVPSAISGVCDGIRVHTPAARVVAQSFGSSVLRGRGVQRMSLGSGVGLGGGLLSQRAKAATSSWAVAGAQHKLAIVKKELELGVSEEPVRAETQAAPVVLCSVERGCLCLEPGLRCGFKWMPVSDYEAKRAAQQSSNDEVLKALGLIPSDKQGAPQSVGARGDGDGDGSSNGSENGGSDRGSDVGTDVGSDVGTDVGSDGGGDVGSDGGGDVGSDGGGGVGSDGGVDVGREWRSGGGDEHGSHSEACGGCDEEEGDSSGCGEKRVKSGVRGGDSSRGCGTSSEGISSHVASQSFPPDASTAATAQNQARVRRASATEPILLAQLDSARERQDERPAQPLGENGLNEMATPASKLVISTTDAAAAHAAANAAANAVTPNAIATATAVNPIATATVTATATATAMNPIAVTTAIAPTPCNTATAVATSTEVNFTASATAAATTTMTTASTTTTAHANAKVTSAVSSTALDTPTATINTANANTADVNTAAAIHAVGTASVDFCAAVAPHHRDSTARQPLPSIAEAAQPLAEAVVGRVANADAVKEAAGTAADRVAARASACRWTVEEAQRDDMPSARTVTKKDAQGGALAGKQVWAQSEAHGGAHNEVQVGARASAVSGISASAGSMSKAGAGSLSNAGARLRRGGGCGGVSHASSRSARARTQQRPSQPRRSAVEEIRPEDSLAVLRPRRVSAQPLAHAAGAAASRRGESQRSAAAWEEAVGAKRRDGVDGQGGGEDGAEDCGGGGDDGGGDDDGEGSVSSSSSDGSGSWWSGDEDSDCCSGGAESDETPARSNARASRGGGGKRKGQARATARRGIGDSSAEEKSCDDEGAEASEGEDVGGAQRTHRKSTSQSGCRSSAQGERRLGRTVPSTKSGSVKPARSSATSVAAPSPARGRGVGKGRAKNFGKDKFEYNNYVRTYLKGSYAGRGGCRGKTGTQSGSIRARYQRNRKHELRRRGSVEPFDDKHASSSLDVQSSLCVEEAAAEAAEAATRGRKWAAGAGAGAAAVSASGAGAGAAAVSASGARAGAGAASGAGVSMLTGAERAALQRARVTSRLPSASPVSERAVFDSFSADIHVRDGEGSVGNGGSCRGGGGGSAREGVPATSGVSAPCFSPEARANAATWDTLSAEEQKLLSHATQMLRHGHDASGEGGEVVLQRVLSTFFGLQAFRPGQLEAITRILSRRSTLLILPTGGGKSLAYQLPALVSTQLTLVVSPLLALIADQIGTLPPALRGALLSSEQSFRQRCETQAALRVRDSCGAASTRVLFVAPERITDRSFQRMMRSLPPVSGCRCAEAGLAAAEAAAAYGLQSARAVCALCGARALPALGYACVDEAHCLSEWSHNFRPAYMCLGRELASLGASAVLALTATATAATVDSIVGGLHMDTGATIRLDAPRSNLTLRAQVVDPEARLGCLLKLLRGDLPRGGAAIVYCATKIETERTSTALRSYGFKVDFYHAGRLSAERHHVHMAFLRGEVQIVCATIAFGMGIDKADVRMVVHFGLPRSPENWVQETGRAGRDGLPSACHALVSEADFRWLHSRCHSDSVDYEQLLTMVRRLLRNARNGFGELPLTRLEGSLDMGKEVVQTALAFLAELDVPSSQHATRRGTASKGSATGLQDGEDEEDEQDEQEEAEEREERAGGRARTCDAAGQRGRAPSPLLQMLPEIRRTAVLSFHAAPADEVAHASPLVAMLLKGVKCNNGAYKCSLVQAASELGMDAHAAHAELVDLQQAGRLRLEMQDPAFYVKLCAAPSAEQVEALALALHERMDAVASLQRLKLVAMTRMLWTLAGKSPPLPDSETQPAFRALLARYFHEELRDEDWRSPVALLQPSGGNGRLRGDVYDFVSSSIEHNVGGKRSASKLVSAKNLNGRVVARIMHGMDSPAFPRKVWGKRTYWGQHKETDFEELRQIATEVLEVLRARWREEDRKNAREAKRARQG